LPLREKKLAVLTAAYEETQADQTEDPYVRELSLHSLKKWINRLTEEIVVYEARRHLVHK